MTVLRIILGILMVLGACSILTMPILSSVAICWIISIFMFVSGIVAIINYVEAKNAEKVAKKAGQPYLKTGIGSLVFGIVAIVVYFVTRNSDNGPLVFMRVVSTIFGLWLVLYGVSLFIFGNGLKKVAAPGWLPLFILGVLVIIMGIACVVNCFAGLTAVGTIFGISMMFAGFGLIFE